MRGALDPQARTWWPVVVAPAAETIKKHAVVQAQSSPNHAPGMRSPQQKNPCGAAELYAQLGAAPSGGVAPDGMKRIVGLQLIP